MDTGKKCIVIAAGDLNIDMIPDYNEQTDTVIAVDGGLLYCGLLNIEPNIIIGDFDSIDEEMTKAVVLIEQKYPEKVIRLKPEKDDTDMLVALKWGLARGFVSFHIYGGLGGRLDHTIANIQCLLYLKNQHAEGFLFESDGIVMVAMDEEKRFQPSMDGYLSLFSLEKKSIVSIDGMKYPLSSYHLTNDYPIGISNQFIPGRNAVISVLSGAVVIMIKWET